MIVSRREIRIWCLFLSLLQSDISQLFSFKVSSGQLTGGNGWITMRPAQSSSLSPSLTVHAPTAFEIFVTQVLTADNELHAQLTAAWLFQYWSVCTAQLVSASGFNPHLYRKTNADEEKKPEATHFTSCMWPEPRLSAIQIKLYVGEWTDLAKIGHPIEFCVICVNKVKEICKLKKKEKPITNLILLRLIRSLIRLLLGSCHCKLLVWLNLNPTRN